MDNNFNNLSLVQVILKWKWHIIIITVAAALCGAIFSGSAFITPLFKSVAVAYPANISPYSDESETEQMLEIINSNSIMDAIVEKYDLWTDYKIDRDDQFARTYMINEYRSKIKIAKTPYAAVSITVMDQNPETACGIAKDILNFYDDKVHTLHKEKVGEVVAMYERQLREKQRDIDSLKKRYTDICTTYGISDISSQSREVTKSMLGGSAKATEMQANMEKYGAEIIDLQTKIAAEGNTYVSIKVDYEQNLRFYNSDLTYSNIITEPFPSDKKAFPVRWVMVALSAMGALLLSIVVAFIIENRKRFVAENK
jgi:uncharacterized protein involved in exopolysaccharide biosynthesis